MPRRPLPSLSETAEILARKRTRPPRRPAPPAGKALTAYLKTLDARFGQTASAPTLLIERWREVAGEVLARNSEPLKLVRARKGGEATLHIRVNGPAAVLIEAQAADILARVNLMLGAGAVGQLRIVQGPVKPPTAKPKPARRRTGPLDAATEAELEKGLANAPDSALKAALLRLGREVARRGS
ncbi:MAG: DciA family protein [Caulobacteraceae bacterium]